VAIIPYAMICSDYINQHNYYQMPFLILVVIAGVYALRELVKFFPSFIRPRGFFYLFLFSLGIAIPAITGSLISFHDSVFLGTDVAGESLKGLTHPHERFFIFTHSQGYAISRYSQRYSGWQDKFKDFIATEKKFKIRYVCIYPVEFIFRLKKYNPEIFEYIESNYHLKEVGFTKDPDKIHYIILEKGNSFHLEDFLKNFSFEIEGKLRRVYRLPFRYKIFYTFTT